jgi:3-phytase
MRPKHALMVALMAGCMMGTVAARAQDAQPLEIPAAAETAGSPGDGVNSPLIWLHPSDATRSLIIGMDDNEGIGVYALDGELLSFDRSFGGVGGSDLRYGFGGSENALIAAASKDRARVLLFTIEPDSATMVSLGGFDTGMRLEGTCLYRSPLTQVMYVVAYSEYGQVEQYALTEDDGTIRAELARALDVGGELEGCTADDALRRLYFSEGENAVWRYGAEPEDGIQRAIVDITGGHIEDEVENLAVYRTGSSEGYLIVTNQTANSLLLYRRTGDNAFVGEFVVAAGDNADSVKEPSGIAVTNLPLGDAYPQGLFITSDDVNSNPNDNSNWKLVSWAEIASALDLSVDTAYDPRTAGQPIDPDAAAVTALAETVPVPAATDAADDPAIWVYPGDPALSLIIGTDKVNGLVTYNLDGSIQQTINIGRLNNVDLRDGFLLDGVPVTVVAATNRTLGGLSVFTIDPETRMLADAVASPILSAVEEVYGLCLYTSPVSGDLYAFINSADTGEVEQHRLIAQGDRITTEVVRRLVVGSQTEGCAVDDENRTVYIGEEAVGLWRFGAEPDAGDVLTQIDSTGEDGHLTADVEGVALYLAEDGGGYVLVSSQGSSTFVVYERGGDNAYIGTFRVIESAYTDAVSGTDGLDVTAFALGAAFPDGLVVVQDDLNLSPASTQNFKLISWRAVAEALGLTIDAR